MNARQSSFIEQYLLDFNARHAAIRAGYRMKSAAVQGHRLLRHPEIAAAIATRADEEERGLRFKADRVVLELMRIAFSDIRRFLVEDEEGRLSLAESTGLPPGETAAVARLRAEAGSPVRSIRLQDKARALRALAKRTGFFERRDHVDIKAILREEARIRKKVLEAAGWACDDDGFTIGPGSPCPRWTEEEDEP
jgi:phage terminase small subunit